MNAPFHTIPAHSADRTVIKFPRPESWGQGSRDVERINQFGLYEIGQTLDKLRRYSEDTEPGAAFSDLMSASTVLGNLIKGDPLPIAVSTSRARELETVVDQLIRENFFPKDEEGNHKFRFPGPDAPKIPSWRWTTIKSALEKFETVFAEDMRENATYYVPRRGIFFTKALVDAADETFPVDVLPHIPKKARENWCAAGRCLAFNLLSASGFHVARAVEATLEVYYQFYCAKGPDQTLHGWNDYILALDGVKGNNGEAVPTAKTMAEIRQMKDDYRNPIVHPRVTLTEPDARMLFANGESLIIAMAQELGKAKEAAAQPQLKLAGE